MTVYLVGAGPGDPGLITVRGAELLARADVVVHDRLVHDALLGLAPPIGAARRRRQEAGHARGASTRSRACWSRLGRTGATVVRLKGGDPFLFGRGGEEVEALLEAGVEVEVVPGVTSAFAAPAYAGVPVTHRGLSTSVTVVTGHVGDPSAPGGVDWEALARAAGTIVVLMGMATRAEISRQARGGRPLPFDSGRGGRVGDHRETAHGPHDPRQDSVPSSSSRRRRSSSERSRASTLRG